MESPSLSAPSVSCTVSNPGVQLQFRQAVRRVLGFSDRYRYCRYTNQTYIVKSEIEHRAPLRIDAGKSISVNTALQTLVHRQLSTSHYENWQSWILEEREWDHDTMQTHSFAGTKAKSKSAFLREETSARQRTKKCSVFSRLEGEDAKSILCKSSYNWLKLSNPKYAFLFLSSALLLLGVGLRFSAPAFAGSKASSATVASVQETRDSEMHQKPEVEIRVEKGDPQSSQESTATAPLSVENPEGPTDAFWDGIEVPNGSMEELLKSYLEKHPDNLRALEALLYTQLEKQHIANALKILKKLVVFEPNEFEWKFMKAQAHDVLGEFKLAREAYKEILTVRPLSARALQVTY